MPGTIRTVAAATAVLAAALCWPAAVPAQTPSPVRFGLSWGFGGDVLPDVPVLVEGVPEPLRQLPSHPDDTWIYGNQPVLRTIPFDSIEPTPLSRSVSLFAAPELTVWRVRVRSGPAFTFHSSVDRGLVRENTGATREVNQQGLPVRGSGQSLVYYNMYPRTSPVPGWLNEASVLVAHDVRIVGGYSVTRFRLDVETGYDRFDSLETYATLEAGSVSLWRAYGGVEASFPLAPSHSAGFQVLVGTVRRPAASNGMTVHANGRWFFSVGASFHHVLVGD